MIDNQQFSSLLGQHQHSAYISFSDTAAAADSAAATLRLDYLGLSSSRVKWLDRMLAFAPNLSSTHVFRVAMVETT